jgi:hypothetical protein
MRVSTLLRQGLLAALILSLTPRWAQANGPSSAPATGAPMIEFQAQAYAGTPYGVCILNAAPWKEGMTPWKDLPSSPGRRLYPALLCTKDRGGFVFLFRGEEPLELRLASGRTLRVPVIPGSPELPGALQTW